MSWTYDARRPRHRPHRVSSASGSWGAVGFRRGHDRVPFEGRVTLVESDRRQVVKAGDLAVGGAYVVTDTPPVPGTPLRLLLEIDDAVVVYLDGVVRWHDFDDDLMPIGCGIQFTGVSENVRAQLSGAVDAEPPAAAADASAPSDASAWVKEIWAGLAAG